MNPILRNILAVIIGWISGGALNMGLVMFGHSVFPIENIDPNDYEAYKEVVPSLTYEYFIFPFLAHALGTLLGAIVAGIIAASHKMYITLGIGAFFLLGGIIAAVMIPAPTWFVALDLVVAYIPMAWLGGKIAMKLSK